MSFYRTKLTNFFLESLRIREERTRYGILWLAEYQKFQEEQKPIGLTVRCIDSRIYKLMNTDDFSRLVGKVLEYRIPGAIISLDNQQDAAIIRMVIENLPEKLKETDIERGLIFIEKHLGCAVAKDIIIHRFTKTPLISTDRRRLVELAYTTMKKTYLENPEYVDKLTNDIASKARLYAKAELWKVYDVEKIVDDELKAKVKKTVSPYMTLLKLEIFFWMLLGSMTIIDIVRRMPEVRQYFEGGYLDLAYGIYDIYSADVYYFVLDRSRLYWQVLNSAKLEELVSFFKAF